MPVTKSRPVDATGPDVSARDFMSLDYLADCFAAGHVHVIPPGASLTDFMREHAEALPPLARNAAKLLIWLNAIAEERARGEADALPEGLREEWASEVFNGDTVLGFYNWCAARRDERGAL